VAGQGSHDEDGDGVVDDCDNCPVDINPLQEDDQEEANGQTADGVGDACDPRPDDGGDSILFFDPFASAGSWNATGGSWANGGDVLVQSDNTVLGAVFDHGPDAGDVVAETEFAFDAFSTSPTTLGSNAGLAIRIDGTITGWYCGFYHLAGATSLNSWALNNNNGGGAFASSPITVSLGAYHRLRTAAVGAAVTCNADGGAATTAVTSNVVTTGNVALRTFRSGITARYVIVYGVAGALP
jgi:hypothetical protein